PSMNTEPAGPNVGLPSGAYPTKTPPLKCDKASNEKSDGIPSSWIAFAAGAATRAPAPRPGPGTESALPSPFGSSAATEAPPVKDGANAEESDVTAPV